MRTVTATTDVIAHENRFPKGTGFVVTDKPKPDATPPEIDGGTAANWLQFGWAQEGKAPTKGRGGADAG